MSALSAMRIFVVPLLRSRWGYHCHSTLPSTSRLTQVVDWASKKWETLSTADPTSMKGKVYKTGNNLMDRVEYEEWFLKAVPVKEDLQNEVTRVPVHYPSMLSKELIDTHLENLLSHRVPYHRKYMIYSSLWIPLSISFVVVPLIPNFPLAYNLFRLYSHYKAYKGAQHLQHLQAQNRLEYHTDTTIDRCLDGVVLTTASKLPLPSEFFSSVKTSSLSRPNMSVLHTDIPGAIDESRIAEMSRVLEAPLMEKELKRARFQVLARVVKERVEEAKDMEVGRGNEKKIDERGHI